MKNALKNKKSFNDQGYAGIIALLTVCSLVLILTFSLSASLFAKKQISKNLLNSAQSYYIAESATEDAVLRVLKPDYTYIAGDHNITLNSTLIARNITTPVGSNTTTINTISPYSNNIRKLSSSLTVTTTNAHFYYGVQVGEGGLIMENNSKVIGSGGAVGNIYSNGSIEGFGTATITGDALVATGMLPDDNNANHDEFGIGKKFGEKNNSSVDIAMKFIPAASGNLSQVSFYLKRLDLPDNSGEIYLTGHDNINDSPNTTVLAETDFILSRIGETDYGWINYTFDSPYSVISGNTYWIVINVTAPNQFNKYFLIGQNAANTDISKYSSNWSVAGSWLPAGGEPAGGYAFKAWVGGSATYLKNVIVGKNAHANTIENSTIAEEARYQTFINSTAGSQIVDPADPAPAAMPLSDSNIADWKASAGAGEDLSPLCNASGTIVLNAGYMNCDFSPAGGSEIVLNGTVWVKGNITFSTNTKMKLSSSYGANSGVIIADNPDDSTEGIINIGNNSPICGTQGYTTSPLACLPSNNTYILLLSIHAGYAENAITIANNSNGAIYYAHNGQAEVSNGAKVKEVTAKKLVIKQNAEVTYESGLENAAFSSGPGGGWEINSWNETQ